MKKELKIAFVKQEVYQDLYVCSHVERNAAEILFSSQGRVGPIGLMAELGADFYILKEEPNRETQIYRKVIPHLAKHLHILKTQTLDKIPGQEFKQPGSKHCNGEFAISCYDVDWGNYDIVISVNVSIPTELVLKFPTTLFGYMIGEANMANGKVHFGYDVTLNQMARGIVSGKCGTIVDFPYTFVKGNTLYKLMEVALGRTSKKTGVFMEINSTKERPVTKIPEHFHPLEEIGQEVVLHHQLIRENLTRIYDAKYFVKMGGRKIRGNSVAEAISLGTLAIMNKDEVIHKELIIDECHVKTMDEVVALINRLEQDDAEYLRLLDKQQKILNKFFFDIPLQSLVECMEDKRQNQRQYTWWDKLCDYFVF